MDQKFSHTDEAGKLKWSTSRESDPRNDKRWPVAWSNLGRPDQARPTAAGIEPMHAAPRWHSGGKLTRTSYLCHPLNLDQIRSTSLQKPVKLKSWPPWGQRTARCRDGSVDGVRRGCTQHLGSLLKVTRAAHRRTRVTSKNGGKSGDWADSLPTPRDLSPGLARRRSRPVPRIRGPVV